MTMTLNSLRCGGNALTVIQPTLGLKVKCILAPKRLQAVDGPNGDSYLLASGDDDAIRHLAIGKPDGCT
jgi:hypothetical protein